MSFGETKAYTMELLEERIGYRFNDRTLLKQAITHSIRLVKELLARM